MNLKSSVVSHTGTLSELIEFENELSKKNETERDKHNTAIIKKRAEEEQVRKKTIEEERHAQLMLRIGTGVAIAFCIILALWVFFSNHDQQAPSSNSNVIDSTIVKPSYTTYYIKSRHANLLSSMQNGQIVYTLPKGTPLSVVNIGPIFCTVNYNGSDLFIRSSRITSTPPKSR